LISFFEDAFEDKNIIKNLRYSRKWMLIEFKSIRSKSVNAKKIMYFYGYIREQTSFFLNTIKKLIRVLEKMVAD